MKLIMVPKRKIYENVVNNKYVMVRAMFGVLLKYRKLMLGLNKTMHQVTVSHSMH